MFYILLLATSKCFFFFYLHLLYACPKTISKYPLKLLDFILQASILESYYLLSTYLELECSVIKIHNSCFIAHL